MLSVCLESAEFERYSDAKKADFGFFHTLSDYSRLAVLQALPLRRIRIDGSTYRGAAALSGRLCDFRLDGFSVFRASNDYKFRFLPDTSEF
jgi:hypothetical protein